MSEYVKKRLFQGFVCMHILHHAKHQAIYGAWMSQELAQHGYHLSPGTLYPILHDLEKNGLLSSQSQNVEGKMRIYYTLTPIGFQTLQDMKLYLSELSREVRELTHDE